MTESCAIKPTIIARPKVVRVNGVTIPRDEIARETQNHPAPKPVDAWKSAAQALVVRELLLQEARRLQIIAQPACDEAGRRETSDEACMRRLVEQEVNTPEPDDDICKRYFEQNQHRFRSPDLFEVSHILIAADRTQERRDAGRAIAQKLIAYLQKTPSAFASLAREHSACPSREVGGNLGQIGPGQTVPEFERALSSMQIGIVHREPLESRYGFHVVRVERCIGGRQLPFETVRENISAYLAERVQRTAIRQYISLLAGRAKLEGIDIEASASPLMQ